jgi:serine/threonine-protein kinase
MSPEQLDCARDVDARSDLWALGAILYELLTGDVPFNGNTLAQVVTAIVQREPASLAVHGISVPTGLEDVIRRALSKSRLQRHASAAELSQALAPYGPSRAELEASSAYWSESTERERPTLDESDTSAPSPHQLMAAFRRAIVTSQPAQGSPARSSRRRALQLGALAGGVMLAAALVVLWPSGTEDAARTIETHISPALALTLDAATAIAGAGRGDVPSEPAQLPLSTAGASALAAEPIPEGKAPEVAPPADADADKATRERVLPKAAVHNHPSAAEPARSIRQVVPVDPLEIPGFGGRH